jgi:hypothetical protein
MLKPDIKEVCRKASAMLEDVLDKKVDSVASACRDNDGWKVCVEVLERKAIPDTQDILSMYEVNLNKDLDLIDYRRTGIRHRGDMIIEEALT